MRNRFHYIIRGIATAAAVAAVGIGVAMADAPATAIERTLNAGWTCIDFNDGLWHCFDPGDASSENGSAINVRVFDQVDESFLGTEQLWSVAVYAGQPCPQDELLFLGGLVACHHYSH